MSATKTAPAKAAKAAAVKATPAAVDWDRLPAPTVTTYVRAAAGRPSVEETTPQAIKDRVLEGHKGSVEQGSAWFRVQRCNTPANAEEFLRLLRRYAVNRKLTLKGKVLTDAELNTLIQNKEVPPSTPSGSVVSFAVVDKISRPRKAKEAS